MTLVNPTQMISGPTAPIIGVGVVVSFSSNVLLIRRGKQPRQGQWSLPGGRQNLGETVEAAARREVYEETGLLLRTCRLLTVVDLIDRDDAGAIIWHYTLIDFFAESTHSQAVAADDAADAAWFTWEAAIGAVEWPETKRILKMAASVQATSRLNLNDPDTEPS